MADLSKYHKTKPKTPKAELNFTIDEDNKISETKTVVAAPVVKKPKFQFTRKHHIITGVGLIVIAIGVTLFLTTKPVDNTTSIANKKTVVAKPVIYYSPLSGEIVTQSESKLPVTAVMIENSLDARPQSGLSQAGVVFEALAEGGITRFMALFQEGQPNSIGPIRSARPYFIDWELPFNATYVHVGGSPDALTQIEGDHVKDVNQFYFGSDFTRISSRIAPHNVYTSMSTLLSLETTLGFNSSTFNGFPRKTDKPAQVPTASDINLGLSSADFAVNYVYQKSTNSYLRSEGGTPMIDANSNAQLSPKVVIAIVVPWSNGALDSSGAYYTDYADIGSGDCFIFQDGIVTKCTWTKSSSTSQITFTSPVGNTILLNRGQTWITAVASDNGVTYQ